MLDTQKALKAPKTDEYYKNYDRIFGNKDKTKNYKVIPDIKADDTKSDMDKQN